METEVYTITNDTNQNYIIYDVGRFVPGETTMALTEDQVHLMKDNAILKLSKAEKASKAVAKSEKSETEEPTSADTKNKDK